MSLILIRYAEIGLKSEPVRRRFLARLVRDISERLEAAGIDHLIESERGRIFLECSDTGAASAVLRTINGLASFSPVISCSSKYNDIMECLNEFGKQRLRAGMSYGLKVRRVGTHPYTSRDIAINGGGAVISHLAEGENRVDLKDPDLWVFVEIRENMAYVFSEVLRGLGGMPSGTQGRVLLYLPPDPSKPMRKRAILSRTLLERRGCTVVPVARGEDIEEWKGEPGPGQDVRALYPIGIGDALAAALKEHRALGVAYPYDLPDVKGAHGSHPRSIPAVELYPTSGLEDDDVDACIDRFSGGEGSEKVNKLLI
ncbi:MAG: THUMP domain-containing protein [Candidatus Thermoplasmatota archaeon]|nr:THUMP domain-containing protein [Candidatus Thermoplasmatota archaeon]